MSEENKVLGELSDELRPILDQIDALDKRTSELKKKRDTIKYKIMELMKGLEIKKFGTDNLTISCKSELMPKINDHDALMDFIFKTKSYDMMRKQMNVTPFRNFFELHRKFPPGTEGVTKDSVLVRRK